MTMKRIAYLTAGLALILLTGCVVTSVYPYYTPKQLTFDAALLGVWTEPDQTNTAAENWKFERVDGSTYKLTLHENDEDIEYDAHLFRLKAHTFLDCLPRERRDCLTPSHVLLRVDGIQPRLELRLLDYDWLGKLIEKNPRAIRHILVPKPTGGNGQGADLVLTADTAELQSFILKHLDNTNAFTALTALLRRSN